MLSRFVESFAGRFVGSFALGRIGMDRSQKYFDMWHYRLDLSGCIVGRSVDFHKIVGQAKEYGQWGSSVCENIFF